MGDHQIDLSRLDRRRLLVIGDLMLDEYLWGAVERISPEAPVQVVSVRREETTLGGAGNVINNLATLGAKISVVGAVGKDAHGRLLIGHLEELGVETGGVLQVSERMTTRKTRVIAENQQVVRIDRETTTAIAPALNKRLLKQMFARLPDADAIIISDYGKGLITPSLISGIAEAAKAQDKLVIADPKGFDFKKYNGVTLITPNTKEASLASGIDIRDEKDLYEAAERLLETVAVEGLLITRGKDGVAYFDRHQAPLLVTTKARQVFDVSGAGDTVVAVLSLALAAGYSMPEAIELSNAAAGVVVSKLGTATVTKTELQEALAPSHDPSVIKNKDLLELEKISRHLKKAGKRIVLTNGCFDLLHAGHIRLFGASKQLGDVLVVALDDDSSVRKLKGAGRPVISASERVKILSAIDNIDFVTVFATKDLPKVIKAVNPDILAKGSNYESTQVLGREIVEGLGGRVALIPLTDDMSSSRIINGIKEK